MEFEFEEELQLLPAAELSLRGNKLVEAMSQQGLDAVLLCDNADLYYVTGRVFCGFVYVDKAGEVSYFVRRPSTLRGEGLHRIKKPEELGNFIPVGLNIGLELDTLPYSRVERLKTAINASAIGNASSVLRQARSVKTAMEIDMLKKSGIKQSLVYNHIPHLYQEGMSDLELQIEIERALRLEGCLGQFRVTGPDMELFMGNVLTGDNADTPSPYDFAMGGAGMSPSLPVGANGTIIAPGKPVMVDMNGNFTGYMTDMTRCYICGDTPDEAARANELSRKICAELSAMAVPGTKAADMYSRAVELVEEAGMADCFMGHRYHAGFVGHGIGISVNEGPVIAPRSRDVLVEGNVIALEPKFVIPGLGAVGIENTYVVGGSAPALCLTTAKEEIVRLD